MYGRAACLPRPSAPSAAGQAGRRPPRRLQAAKDRWPRRPPAPPLRRKRGRTLQLGNGCLHPRAGASRRANSG
eukprot:4204085-Alexandrium_andersonii.AAC.1